MSALRGEGSDSRSGGGGSDCGGVVGTVAFLRRANGKDEGGGERGSVCAATASVGVGNTIESS